MSVEAMNWAWKQHIPDVVDVKHGDTVSPHLAKLVLVRLADQANAEGRCQKSRGSLAAFCNGASKPTITRALRHLEQLGLITRILKRGHPTQYQLHLRRQPVQIDEVSSQPMTPPSSQPITPGHEGVIAVDKGGVIAADDTSAAGVIAADKGGVIAADEVKKNPSTKNNPSERQRSPRDPDPVWDTVVEVCIGAPDPDDPGDRRAWGRTVRDVRKRCQRAGVEPVAEIRARARRYRQLWPNATLTHNALRERWSDIAPPPAGPVESYTPPPELSPEDRAASERAARALAEERRRGRGTVRALRTAAEIAAADGPVEGVGS